MSKNMLCHRKCRKIIRKYIKDYCFYTGEYSCFTKNTRILLVIIYKETKNGYTIWDIDALLINRNGNSSLYITHEEYEQNV